MKLPVFRTVGATLIFSLRHFPAFYLLSLLTALPTYLLGSSALDPAGSSGTWRGDLAGAGEVMLAGVATAVMMWTRIRDQQGERWTVFAALRDALEHLPTVLGVGAIVAIVTTVISLMYEVLGTVTASAVVAPIGATLYLSVIFAVVMPHAAVDDAGPLESIGQSATLTAGSRFRILGTYILLGVPVGLLVFVLCFTIFDGMPGNHVLPLMLLFGSSMLNVFFLPLPVLLYEQLAGLEDGMPLGETAAVFD